MSESLLLRLESSSEDEEIHPHKRQERDTVASSSSTSSFLLPEDNDENPYKRPRLVGQPQQQQQQQGGTSTDDCCHAIRSPSCNSTSSVSWTVAASSSEDTEWTTDMEKNHPCPRLFERTGSGRWRVRPETRPVVPHSWSVSSTRTEPSDKEEEEEEEEGDDAELREEEEEEDDDAVVEMEVDVDVLTDSVKSWTLTNLKALRRNAVHDAKMRQLQVKKAKRDVMRALTFMRRSSSVEVEDDGSERSVGSSV